MWVALLSGVAAAAVASLAVRRRWSAILLAVAPLAAAAHLFGLRERVADEPLSLAASWIPALDLTLRLRLDGLSLLFCLVVTFVAAAVLLYAPAYLRDHPRRGRFCALLLLFQSAMIGLVLADDLLLLFCFWEATSLVSYLLVGFDSERKEARKAALQALLVTGVGGLALLAGLVLLGEAAGTFQLSELPARSERILADARLPGIVVLVLLGAFTKSAQVPFHFWLPGAMAAPTPASAFLHAATMVKAGIYLLLRLAPVLEGSALWTWALVTVGGASAVLGGLLAPFQDHLKRLLAYTTISALGTLVLLIGIGTDAALQAALVFLVAHALYKGALFLVAGTVTHETGEKAFERLGGLGRRMRWTASAGLFGVLAMAGIPPTLGFVGKEAIFRATVHGGIAPAPLTVAAVAGAAAVVAAGFVLFRLTFAGPSRGAAERAHEGPAELVVGPLALAVLAVVLGLGVGALDDALLAPALASLRREAPDSLALWHGLDPALGLEALALATGTLLAVARPRVVRASAILRPLGAFGPARLYDHALAGLLAAGRAAAAVWGKHLRTGVQTVVVGALGLVGWSLFGRPPHGTLLAGPTPRVVELGSVALVVAGVVVAVASRTRLVTVAALGATGYGIALLFTYFGAPDLAMTQFVVETLAVVLFVLAFHRLPAFRPTPSRLARAVDAALASAVGLLMAALVLSALHAEIAPSGSAFYVDSAAAAHGRNVVNVILSDFRALDTLGEITVLAVTGVGVAALFRRLERPEPTA